MSFTEMPASQAPAQIPGLRCEPGVPDPLLGEVPIFPASRAGPLPLSFEQQRLWILSRSGESHGIDHLPLALRLSGVLDEPALVGALNALVARHETLRTTFHEVDGTGFQRIGPAESAFALSRLDLSGDPQPEGRLAELAHEESVAPFDLESGPVARGRLIRMNADDHVLLITLHHIVSDYWSMAIMARELKLLYQAYLRGETPPLPPLAIQYADYAVRQRQFLSTELLAGQANYWRDALAAAPALLELPTDRKRPDRQSFDGSLVRLELDASLIQGLKALGQRCETTLFMIVLAGWAAVLSRMSGQQKLVIGTPNANRARPDLAGLIGFFVNPLALLLDLSGDPTVEEVLHRVRAVTVRAQENQDLPFEQVVAQTNPVRSLAHTPLFQVMFVWQDQDSRESHNPGLAFTKLPLTTPMASFDLQLNLSAAGGQISGELIFARSLFDAPTIERHAVYLRRMLWQMVADPSQPLNAVPMLPPEETHRLLVEWNGAAAPYPQDRCIHLLFEEQVDRNPRAVAVVFEDASLTYAELDERANRLAHYLLGRGIKPDDRVAICVERGLDMVVGLLGVLKAGGAYVPLDPAYPTDRLSYMLNDCAPVALLSHGASHAAVDAAIAGLTTPPPVIDLDTGILPWNQLPVRRVAPSALGLTSRHLAYVIYTSGSTGRPKGVMIEHRGLIAVRLAYQQPYGLRADLTHLQMASMSFDVFTADVIRSLTFGGKLVICPRLSTLDPGALYDALRRHSIGIAEFVPVALAQLTNHLERTGSDLSFMERVICSSDLWSAEDCRRLRRVCGPDVRILNSYGATEATIDSTFFEVENDPIPGATTVPIGRPMLNTRIYVLDLGMKPVPQGVVGEMWIGGPGIARGYLNRPELTAERFVASPFVDGDRLYKTGDQVRYLPDGTIEFLGRSDFQVKVRGFRIELGEIEARLAQYPTIQRVVVLAREDTPGDKRLVGYFTATAEVRLALLRAHLSAALPEYMVPSGYVQLEGMPVNANGKLDRNALPAPGEADYPLHSYQVPDGPAEASLAAIWANILGIERVGRHDRFFAVGGNSLTAIQISAQIRERFNINLLRFLLQDATIAILAKKLEENRTTVAAQNGNSNDCLSNCAH
jgi:syringomycin synthetase protein SyrE